MKKEDTSSGSIEPAPRPRVHADWTVWDQTVAQDLRPPRPDGTVAPEAGQTIGRYEVLGRVGAGGMGQVFRAHDPELQRIIAIKVHNLHPGPNSSMLELRSRLLREGRALACISDPNVVTVYDVGLFRGQVFVAMELIPGCDLKEWIGAQHRSPRQIIETYLGAADGLAAVHRVGVIHRDVKPANFVVGNDGRVRVVDFGLACADTTEAPEAATLALGDVTEANFVMGTPAYIAPEQLACDTLDDRCDQFSFCVALWEALSGSLPFAAATLEQRAEAIEGEVLQGRKKIPGAIRSILERGLRADPRRRHESMVELARKLRAALDRPKRLATWTMGLLVLVVALAAIWGITKTPALHPGSSHPSASREGDTAQAPETNAAPKFHKIFQRATALYLHDESNESVALLETIVDHPRLAEYPLLASEVWDLATTIHFQLGNRQRAHEMSALLQKLATTTHDDELLLHVWITRFEIDIDSWDSSEFHRHIDEARELATRLPGDAAAFDLEMAILEGHLQQADIDSARICLRALRDSPQSQDNDWKTLLAEAGARLAVMDRQFVEALREARVGLAAYRHDGLLIPTVAWSLMASQATALAQRGKRKQAEAIWTRLFRELHAAPSLPATHFLQALAADRASQGFRAEARRALGELEAVRALEPESFEGARLDERP